MNEKQKKFIINILIAILCITGVFVIPSLFELLFIKFKINSIISSMLAELLFILLLIALFYKDLVKEFKIYTKNFKYNIKTGFKYYIAGYLCMIFFNLIISMVLNNISQNEEGVRDLLYNLPIFAFINIAIFAPIAEELSFRKSISKIFKNKYVFAITSGLLFGCAHLTTNFISNTFVFSDLLYILPYGTLGFMFAFMNFETKTTFTSITMHAFHNSVTCILLLIVHFSGVF